MSTSLMLIAAVAAVVAMAMLGRGRPIVRTVMWVGLSMTLFFLAWLVLMILSARHR